VQSQDSPPGQANAKRTLYLLLQTPPDQTEELILQTIKNGIQAARLQIRGEPIIYNISPVFMEEIQRLIHGGRWQVQPADDPKGGDTNESTLGSTKGNVTIRHLGAADNIYEIRLPTHSYLIKEMSVEYSNGKTKTYKVASPKDKQTPTLELRYPGSYIFRSDDKEIPKKCTLKLLDQMGEKDFTVEWPVQSKAYLIVLSGYEGNIQELFKVVQDPNRVANPIQLQSLDQHIFAIASVGLEAEEGSFIRGNTLTVTVPDLKTRNVRHVWIYFPLREEEVDKEIKRWSEHKSVDLPRLIENELVRSTELSQIDKTSVGQPKWWETTRNGNQFIRSFTLVDIPDLAEAIPSMWMLAVWVFEDAQGKKELIFVKNRAGKTVAMLPDEIITWRRSLPQLKNIRK
jgi:hypothetical protein